MQNDPVLNSRETIYAILSLLLIIYISSSKALRFAVKNILKSLAVKNIISIYTLATLYIISGVFLLSHLGFWSIDLLKDTIFWLLFSGYISLFNAKDIRNSKKFIFKALLDNFKFSALIEFITNKFTFNIYIEALFIPFIIFITLLYYYSSIDQRHKIVHNFSKFIIVSINIFLISYCFYQLYTQIILFITLKNFKEFSLPIILSIYYIPFLYLIKLYMDFETINIVFKSNITDNKIYKYALYTGLKIFWNDLEQLNRFKQNISYKHPKSRFQVNKIIVNTILNRKYEKKPKNIPFNLGLSPYKAKAFLDELGIITNYYKNCYDDEFISASEYIKLDESILSNNIAYYVSGKQTIAKQLKIVLNINNLEYEQIANEKFTNCAEVLYCHVFNKEIKHQLLNSLKTKKGFILSEGPYEILFKKTLFHNKAKGYMLVFEINHIHNLMLTKPKL